MSGKPAQIPRVVNYGGTDNDEDNHIQGSQRRRSTISTIRQSIVIMAGHTKEALHSHTMSTLALCTSVFSMAYMLMSVFPYSGFMCMQLVDGLTYESAGSYAGILSGSLMIGRLFSAWPLGIMCDRYGRKFVLLLSTTSNAVLILAFGFSSSFKYAVVVRFLTGLLNGTMVAARTAVTELAHGDHDLEAKGMGLVMAQIGLGMLVGPAIGGLLSEPITQYPNVEFGIWESMLTKYPFVLPNIVGFAINITSTILIMLSVDETLPADKLRSPKYIIPDAIQYLVDVSKNVTGGANNTEYQRVSSVTTEEASNDNDSEADSIEADLKIIGSHFGETGDCVLMATPESRASFTAALHRPSSVQPTSTTIESIEEGEEQRQNSIISMISHSPMSLMQNDRVRECIWLYWITTFASTAQGECFPLFAMARTGGLGIEETSIGLINSGSGLLFVICQYFIFALSMKKFGLHKTMVSSCLLSVPPVLLIPVSLLIKSQTVMIVYLSIVNGVMLIAFSNWNAALTIAQESPCFYCFIMCMSSM